MSVASQLTRRVMAEIDDDFIVFEFGHVFMDPNNDILSFFENV